MAAADPQRRIERGQLFRRQRDVASLRFRNEVYGAAVTLDCFLTQSDAHAIRVKPGEEVCKLIPHFERLRLVEITCQ